MTKFVVTNDWQSNNVNLTVHTRWRELCFEIDMGLIHKLGKESYIILEELPNSDYEFAGIYNGNTGEIQVVYCKEGIVCEEKDSERMNKIRNEFVHFLFSTMSVNGFLL